MDKKKKMHIVFAGSLEVEVEEGFELEDLIEKVYYYDRDEIDLEVMGYFEDGKCDAKLNFTIEETKEGAIFGNNIIRWFDWLLK